MGLMNIIALKGMASGLIRFVTPAMVSLLRQPVVIAPLKSGIFQVYYYKP